MGQPFLGEIRMFSGNYAPEGWALCDGSELPINGQYEALYAVIGQTYGGNGEASFALPDFRARGPVGSGQAQVGSFVPGQTADTATESTGGQPASPVLCVTFIICVEGLFPVRS
jgi:microcystin-dependent protein